MKPEPFTIRGGLLLALLSTILTQLAIIPAQAQTGPFNKLIQATGISTVVSGFIVGASVVNGGDGYPAPPAVSVSDPSGSNVVIVAAISVNGVVTNLTVKNAGSHYSAAPKLVIAPPPTNSSLTDINIIIGPYVTDNTKSGLATSSVGNWAASVTNFPPGGFYTNYASISFYLAGFPGATNGLGVIDTGLGSVSAPKTNNFPVNVTNAVTVYTLMNSLYGELGFTNGTLAFYGSQGAYASFNLVQGYNLRDYNNDGWNNVVSSNIMSLYWGASKNARLDCQGWMLPADFFFQTLTNIEVRSFGNNPDGVPILAAITVRTSGPSVLANATGSQVVCQWPSTPTNYELQATASLQAPAWTTVPHGMVVTNNQFVGTNMITLTNQFYRLISMP